MKFGRRLRLYLMGFGIGILFVIVVFNERLSLLTSWLPGQRVQDRLQQTSALFTEVSLCELECYGLDTNDVSLAKESGSVRFRLSDTHSEPKMYVLDAELEKGNFRFSFLAADSSSTLSKVERLDLITNCACDD